MPQPNFCRILLFLANTVGAALVFPHPAFCQTSAADTDRSALAQTEAPQELPPVIVEEGRIQNLVDVAETASEGQVGKAEFESRPILRTGELLETVPGLIVSQHSGTGKANQYYLRGFNLDHGTDFRTEVDGMPVNMPTHAHGQGYTDLNFIIPELVDHIDYKKGVYYAEQGDFSSAGAADFTLNDTLPEGLAKITVGTDDYVRLMTGDSQKVGVGTLLLGLEMEYYEGPWDLGEDFNKINGMARYTIGDSRESLSITAMAYHGVWNSTDQIPERAVNDGLIDRFGNLDSTDGGRTSRYSLSANWKQKTKDEAHDANAYVIDYGLNLYSNFTYFLDDPKNGDQFEQKDRRVIFGGATGHEYYGKLLGKDTSTKVGVQLRNDIIPTVALLRTKERQLVSTTRDDSVEESTVGVYGKNETRWMEKLRTTVGLRADGYYFHVDSSTEENSGTEWTGKISPKGSLVVGPWYGTELYVSGGLGFHSNDARGTTISVSPTSGEPVGSVTPLVLSKGAEVGARTAFTDNLQSTLSFWVLDLGSELVFSGDAGETEPNRASQRYGIELANYYRPLPWISLDADFAATRARFTEDDPAGDRVPGAVETVISSGITLGSLEQGPFGALRLRYFGPRPLIEDNSVRSDSTTLFNARAGYTYQKLQLAVEALNLLNSHDHDIDYFYPSRLPGEPEEGVSDIHYHPVEPFELRVTATYRF